MKQEKKETKQSLKYQRDKNREKVRGIFRYYESPGSQLKFVFREFKGDPIERYELIDGEPYSIPLGVAKHLNKRGWYPVHQYALDKDGKPSMRVGQKVRRFGFQSLEFVDVEELNTPDKKIIQVENVAESMNEQMRV